MKGRLKGDRLTNNRWHDSDNDSHFDCQNFNLNEWQDDDSILYMYDCILLSGLGVVVQKHALKVTGKLSRRKKPKHDVI